jgi:transcriptional regulator with XRE-family HTH domain
MVYHFNTSRVTLQGADVNIPLIKARRDALGLSQYDLAEVLEVKRSTVANWEIGRGDPDSRTIRRLAEVLQISADDLLADPEPQTEAVAASP